MRYSILAILFLSLVSARASAQSPTNSWESLNALRPGQTVEVIDMNLRSFKDELVSVTDEGITLRAKKNEVTVVRDDVLRVTLREKSKRGRNALIGSAVGAAAGFAVGVALCHGDCDLARDIAWGLPAMTGTGIGAGIGAAFPGYQTLYRAPMRQARGATH